MTASGHSARNRGRPTRSVVPLLAGAALLALLGGCERPPVEMKQSGFRGTGMDQVINPRLDAVKADRNVLPAALPAAPSEGPLASAVYQNVQVLKDLNVGEFTRVMLAMTQWVAPPDQSCNYCHAADMSKDDKYTKVVARRMLQMTRDINEHWKTHVGKTGVTCYTCHRGNVVPQYVWFKNPGETQARGTMQRDRNLYSPLGTIGTTSLPYDPFSKYLLGNSEIRVIANEALPGSDHNTIQHTETTYALMEHISTSLGVNCTYCHNTRSMAVWDSGTPQRQTAWFGIRMVRNLNTNYLESLTGTFPKHRLGVLGDVAKVNCMTCHQGVFKPLYGESMAKDYPELTGEMHHVQPGETPPAEAAPAMATPTASNLAAPQAQARVN